MFEAAVASTVNGLLDSDAFGPSSVVVTSVLQGSVIVRFSLLVPTQAALSLANAFFAVEASVVNGALLVALVNADPALFSDVNIAFNSTTGCGTCGSYPSPSSTPTAAQSCNAGFVLAGLATCSAAPFCPAGTADNGNGCIDNTGNVTPYHCPAGSTLVSTANNQLCYQAAIQACPVGFTLQADAGTCFVSCPPSFFRLGGLCNRAIICPAGTYFDQSQSNPRYFCRDIDECDAPSACNGKGTCANTYGSYSCVCQSGWGGATCSQYTGPSTSATTAKATTSTTPGAFTSEPPITSPSYQPTSDAAASSSNQTSIGIGVGVGAGGLLVVLVLLVVLARRRRARRESSVDLHGPSSMTTARPRPKINPDEIDLEAGGRGNTAATEDRPRVQTKFQQDGAFQKPPAKPANGRTLVLNQTYAAADAVGKPAPKVKVLRDARLDGESDDRVIKPVPKKQSVQAEMMF